MVFRYFSDIPEGWKREWEGKRGFMCGRVESFGLASYSANPLPALAIFCFFFFFFSFFVFFVFFFVFFFGSIFSRIVLRCFA